MVQDIYIVTLIIVGIMIFIFIMIKKDKKVVSEPFIISWDDNENNCYEKSEEIEYSETQRALHIMLNELEAIGKEYGEIYDRECRKQMSTALFNIFILDKKEYLLPRRFGLYHEDANRAVYIALNKYLVRISDLANGLEVTDARGRMSLVQDEGVLSNEEQTFKNFFLRGLGFSNSSY